MQNPPNAINAVAAVGMIGFAIHNYIKTNRLHRKQTQESLNRIRASVQSFHVALERPSVLDVGQMRAGRNPINDFLIDLEFNRIMRQNQI